MSDCRTRIQTLQTGRRLTRDAQTTLLKHGPTMIQHFCFVYFSADGGTLLQQNGANSPVNFDDGTYDENDQSK